MGGGGFTGGAQKSITSNRSLRRGRNNLFERKAPKVSFKPKLDSLEASAQIRQKFRDQLERERAIDRRNSVIGIVFGLIVIGTALAYHDLILRSLIWMGERL